MDNSFEKPTYAPVTYTEGVPNRCTECSRQRTIVSNYAISKTKVSDGSKFTVIDSDGVTTETTTYKKENGNLIVRKTVDQYVNGVNIHICDDVTCTPQKRAKKDRTPAPAVVNGEELPVLPDLGDCTICYEPYRKVEDVAFLPCAHCFHKKCVDKWLKKHNTCPVCRIDPANSRTI